MVLYELDHLGHGLCREDRQQVGDEQELVGFVADWRTWFKLAECNALTLIGAGPPPVDQWWVEPMHIIVLVVDEEAFAHSTVSISICIHIEPELNSFRLIVSYLISSGSKDALFDAITTSLSVKTADIFQSFSFYSFSTSPLFYVLSTISIN